MTDQSGFDLLAELIVLTDRLNEAPHQLIPLVLEQFMPTDSRFETGLLLFSSIRVGLTLSRVIFLPPWFVADIGQSYRP